MGHSPPKHVSGKLILKWSSQDRNQQFETVYCCCGWQFDLLYHNISSKQAYVVLSVNTNVYSELLLGLYAIKEKAVWVKGVFGLLEG